MGYQEYVYKIDNIEKFAKKRKKVDSFIDEECCEVINYCLVEFKYDFKNIEKGMYVYATGDRQFGLKFLNYLDNKITKGSSYVGTIESALDSYHWEDNEYDVKLRELFKEKSTNFARIIYEKQPTKSKQLERSLF